MTNAKPRLLIVSYTPTARSPRVLKQISEFGGRYHVTTAGYGPAPRGVDEHIELEFPPSPTGWARVPGIFSLLLLLRIYRAYVRLEPVDAATYRTLKDREWDLVIAHDAQTLYVSSRLRSRFGVLADMHEFAPRQNEPSARWLLLDQPYFVWLCRTYATRAVAVTTVSPGIVDAYRSEFGIDARLVINATPYLDIEPSQTRWPIRLVHSGVAAPDRKLETLVTAVKASSADLTLDLFLLDGTAGYVDQLRSVAGDDRRIQFRDAVPYDRLVATLAQYDVGLHVIAPTSFNNQWSLPNKFFDYVQARLGVVIGPSPAMVDFVHRYEFGEVAQGFEAADLAAVLDTLTPEKVERWKSASNRCSRELSGEEQAKIWGRIVAGIVEAEG